MYNPLLSIASKSPEMVRGGRFGEQKRPKNQASLMSKLKATWDILGQPVVDAGSRLQNASLYDMLGNQNPDTVGRIGADAATIAGVATAGSMPVPKPTNALNMGIRAWHGSPHDFGRFDISHMGTGQGAQSFGDGHYFAGYEPIAKDYRRNLGFKSLWENVFNNIDINDGDPSEIIDLIKRGILPKDQARLLTELDNHGWLGFDHAGDAIKATKKELHNFDPTPELEDAVNKLGHMYEVNINADPEHLLNWDEPLMEQSPYVVSKLGHVAERAAREINTSAEALRSNFSGVTQKEIDELKMRPEHLTGQDIYESLRSRHDSIAHGRPSWDSPAWPTGKIEGPTSSLLSRGIPGIKFLDARSRSPLETKPTYNYVIGKDELISIVKKYGIGAAAALLGYANYDGKAQAAPTKKPLEITIPGGGLPVR